MLWALHEAPCANPTQRVILLAMADPAHDDGTCSFRSQATLAGIVGCSDRTIREHLSDMEERGLIRRGDQELVSHYRGDRRPIVWDLAMPRAEISSGRKFDVENGNGRKSDVATAGSSAGHGRKWGSDKPSTNQELNRGKSPDSVTPSLASLRLAELSSCEHGAPTGRCGICRVAM